MSPRFSPGDGPFKFEVKLTGHENMETAALKPPFDVPTIFGTRARVPVRGTINGFPFRSSLCNMGEGHMMVVNKQLRDGAGCKAGDVVKVVMERDTAPRVVQVPPDLNNIILQSKAYEAAWTKLSFTHQKEWVLTIEGAKKEETRQRRIERLLTLLRSRTQE